MLSKKLFETFTLASKCGKYSETVGTGPKNLKRFVNSRIKVHK